jgi:hypothetical protein
MRRIAAFLLGLTLLYCGVSMLKAQVNLPLMGVGPTVAGGCSSTATAYESALVSASGAPTAGTQTAINTLLNGMASDGTLCKLDVLYLFAINSNGVGDLGAANGLVNAANPGTFNGTANGNVSTGCAGSTNCFSANNGWSGVDASTTIYIDTGFNPSTATSPKFTRNSSHVMAWPYTNAASGASGGAAIGLILGSTNTSRVYPRYSDNNFYSDANSATNATGVSNNTSTGGMYLVSRTGASSVDHYKITTNQGNTSEASAAVLNDNFAVLAQRVAGSTVNFGSALQLAAVSIGGGLSSTDVSNLESRLCTYLSSASVHGSC